MSTASGQAASAALLAQAQEWRRRAETASSLEREIEALTQARATSRAELATLTSTLQEVRRAAAIATETHKRVEAELTQSRAAEQEHSALARRQESELLAAESLNAKLTTQLSDLRRRNETLRTQRDKFRDRLQAQYDLKWSRIGGVIRSSGRNPAAIAKMPIRLAREIRRTPHRTATPGSGEGTRASQGQDDKPPRSSVVKVAQEHREAGDHETALRLLDEALAARPQNADLLREQRSTLVASGELSAALATTRRLVRAQRSEANRAAETQLVGRLRDLDCTWYPDLGPPETLQPANPGSVLHLLKESVPFHERGYTMRSRYALLSQLQAGLQPSVITSLGFPRLDGFDEFPAVDSIDGIEHHRLDLGSEYPYRRIPFDQAIANQAWMAAEVVRKIRPATIHANSGFRGYDTAVTALALGRRFKIPVVYDVRSFLESTWTGDISRSERGEHYRLRVARENQCMHDADLVFTIANTMRDEIIRRGVDAEKIVVIPNAVDPQQFPPRDRDHELARELGLGGKTVLGYVSNIGRREGIDVLITAMKVLRDQRDDVACLVVGDGPELETLRQLRSDLGLDDVVVLTGPVPHDQVARYYSLIDLFVVPRRDDHAARLVTPLKPFEAMSMGLPLLVSDLPALAEIAAPGERGFTFTPEDPHALAAAAERLLDDPELRRRIGDAGRAWVLSERTWESNSRRYIEAYGRLGVHPARQS